MYPKNKLGIIVAGLWGSMGTASVEAQPADLNLAPQIIESSPVLQRWLEAIPDLQTAIAQDPSFTTIWRLGYIYSPSSQGGKSGLAVGVEDLGINQTWPLTFRADYQTNFGAAHNGGLDVQYYLLPLGTTVNITPLIGYRYWQTSQYHTQGLNLGAKVIFALSPTGAADVRWSQSFIAPGSNTEAGLTQVSLGYALTNHLRLATAWQQQNSKAQKDHSFVFYWEWIP